MRIADAAAMERAGARIAAALGKARRRPLASPGGALSVHLSGDLGAGKTTLVRGLLRALGHRGVVRSPTYTLLESYPDLGVPVHHFDLYRLADPEELELIGARDYFAAGTLWLVEWPERGEGMLPPADLELRITLAGAARELRSAASSRAGECLLERLRGGG